MEHDSPLPPSFSPPSDPHGQVSPDADAIITPLVQSAGWLKFLGVMSILSGVACALSCYGIIIAWLPIWLGILQWQAGDRLSVGHAARDVNTMTMGSDKLRLAFKVQGIFVICILAFYIIIFFIFGAALLAGGLAGAAGAGGTP